MTNDALAVVFSIFLLISQFAFAATYWQNCSSLSTPLSSVMLPCLSTALLTVGMLTSQWLSSGRHRGDTRPRDSSIGFAQSRPGGFSPYRL